MKKVIITGATGMVGKGILLECLDHPRIEQVLTINRSALGISHPKLKELIHNSFSDYVFGKRSIEQPFSDRKRGAITIAC